MIESEDGTVTGSIDVSRLDEIEPKTDEAKAQIEALKAENQAAREQADKDAEAKAESEKATSVEGLKESQKETTTKSAPVGEQPKQSASRSGKE